MVAAAIRLVISRHLLDEFEEDLATGDRDLLALEWHGDIEILTPAALARLQQPNR